MLPVLALGSYGLIALVPVLFANTRGKIAEKATDYSYRTRCVLRLRDAYRH